MMNYGIGDGNDASVVFSGRLLILNTGVCVRSGQVQQFRVVSSMQLSDNLSHK